MVRRFASLRKLPAKPDVIFVRNLDQEPRLGL
jgi:hypothetical protein